MAFEAAQQIWRRLYRLAIILAIFVVLACLFHYLKTLCIMLLVGSLIAFVLDPLVERLAQRIPRTLAIALTYLVLVLALAVGVGYLVPRIIGQLQHFQRQLPTYQTYLQEWTGQAQDYYADLPESVRAAVANAQTRLQESGKAFLQGMVAFILSLLGWLAKGVIMLVLSIYLLIDKAILRDGSLRLVPRRYRREVATLMGEIFTVLRSYLRGQIMVIGFVAVTVTTVLLLADIPYALTIGTMAGLLEVIPYFGAAAGAIPAIILGLIKYGPEGAGLLALFFVAVNQVEGHVVIPFVMGRSMEMRPLAVLLSLLVGAEVAGIAGLAVAVPVVRILQILGAYLLRGWQLTHPSDSDEAPPPALVETENPLPASFAEAGLESPPNPGPEVPPIEGD